MSRYLAQDAGQMAQAYGCVGDGAEPERSRFGGAHAGERGNEDCLSQATLLLWDACLSALQASIPFLRILRCTAACSLIACPDFFWHAMEIIALFA